MISDPQEPALDAADLEEGLPDAAPEADVVEQHQHSSGRDDRDPLPSEVPVEADPADVDEQRRAVGDDDSDDYR
jgi:hypothetical protein